LAKTLLVDLLLVIGSARLKRVLGRNGGKRMQNAKRQRSGSDENKKWLQP
jgi:hypothetical protein